MPLDCLASCNSTLAFTLHTSKGQARSYVLGQLPAQSVRSEACLICKPSTHWQTYLVFSRVFCIFLVILSIAACLFPSAKRSTLFSTTISFWQAICPITRHSADWVCIPLVTSMTSIIRSMIWAPGRREDKVRNGKGRG